MLEEIALQIAEKITDRTGISAFTADRIDEVLAHYRKNGGPRFFAIVYAAVTPSELQNNMDELPAGCQESEIDIISLDVRIAIKTYAKSIEEVDDIANTIRSTFSPSITFEIPNPLDGSPLSHEIYLSETRQVPQLESSGLYSVDLTSDPRNETIIIDIPYKESNKIVSLADHFELNEILAIYSYYMRLLNGKEQSNLCETKRRADVIANSLGIDMNPSEKTDYQPRSVEAASVYLQTMILNPSATMLDAVKAYKSSIFNSLQ